MGAERDRERFRHCSGRRLVGAVCHRHAGRFEAELLGGIKENGAEIVAAIRDDGEISADTEGKLKAFLDDFVKKFA